MTNTHELPEWYGGHKEVHGAGCHGTCSFGYDHTFGCSCSGCLERDKPRWLRLYYGTMTPQMFWNQYNEFQGWSIPRLQNEILRLRDLVQTREDRIYEIENYYNPSVFVSREECDLEVKDTFYTKVYEEREEP